MLLSIALIVGAYLLGSIASAIIVSRMMGLGDPREGGSGNPGATNVLRLGGKKAAAITLLGDVLKGLLPVLIGAALNQPLWVLGAIAVAAFLGHLYPIFFGFKGGKGVATAVGAILGLSGWLALALIATWLLVVLLTRYSSLAALVSAALAPAYALALTAPVYAYAVAAIAALLIWRHRANIRRLMAGEEDKIGAKSKANASTE
ncbi:MAG: glycerol-3-phosphate 1-O-acyltransferase PlsY [Pseudomonadota bacterium]